jgi:hypothetical protein
MLAGQPDAIDHDTIVGRHYAELLFIGFCAFKVLRRWNASEALCQNDDS